MALIRFRFHDPYALGSLSLLPAYLFGVAATGLHSGRTGIIARWRGAFRPATLPGNVADSHGQIA